MGTFVSELGELKIPDDRWPAFLRDARTVAYAGGLLAISYFSYHGKRLSLLRFPSFEEESTAIDFTYSYFENSIWENAGISLKYKIVYSEKIGWNQFNMAVQALYYLAETYSETMYVTRNDSIAIPGMTMRWLRYVLNRDIDFKWRNDLWAILEMDVLRQRDPNDPFICRDFLDCHFVACTDWMSLLNVWAVISNSDVFAQTMQELDTMEDYQPTLPNEKNVLLTIVKVIRILKEQTSAYREHSGLTEEEQIQFLLGLVTCGHDERKRSFRDDDLSLMMLGIAFLPPQIAVKVISESYNTKFWPLWWQVRDHIKIEPINYYNGIVPEADREIVDTESFFDVSSADRLLWWREDGDVNISDETRQWLDELSARFHALEEESLEENTAVWRERLIDLLAENRKALMFEDTFFEFLGSFHRREYRAAVRLLEELIDDAVASRRFQALLANPALRMEALGF